MVYIKAVPDALRIERAVQLSPGRDFLCVIEAGQLFRPKADTFTGLKLIEMQALGVGARAEQGKAFYGDCQIGVYTSLECFRLCFIPGGCRAVDALKNSPAGKKYTQAQRNQFFRSRALSGEPANDKKQTGDAKEEN